MTKFEKIDNLPIITKLIIGAIFSLIVVINYSIFVF